MSNSVLGTFWRIKRSGITLLFVACVMLVQSIVVHASVGAGGSFAGTNYRVQTGNSLINTGTDFNFVNNFDQTITVDFNFEAPSGVVIELPSAPVQLAARATYRIPIRITTTASTPIGTFPLRIVGRVIPDNVNGVEISGSAGLNASITVQGIAPTTPPTFTLVERTLTSFIISVFNPDPDPVTVIYSLGVNPPVDASIDIAPGASVNLTFLNLDSNTTYTVFATATATPRDESTVASFSVTTLAPPPPPDDEEQEPAPPAVPPVTTTPPATGGGGGGSPININVLVIELDPNFYELDVFSTFSPPVMNAYVSIRDNVRETSRIDLTNRVIVTGQVNPNVIGRYELRYFLRYNNQSLEEVVVVNVRDQIAPRITSAIEVTIKVGDPFSYRLVASDNYDAFDDLIITGFPTNVDTTSVGVQRFNVVVSDQSGNRTPFLFTVNVRDRIITPIPLTINDVEITLNAIEGLFDETNYRSEIAVASNVPLRNSPSWTLFTGQEVTQGERELVYVRLTDSQGNTLIVAVDLIQGRVVPIDSDNNIITADEWWRVLLRLSNVLVWIVPFALLLGAWAWLISYIAKRRPTYTVVFKEVGVVVSEQTVRRGKAAIAPNSGPWNVAFDRITRDLVVERTELIAASAAAVPPKGKPVHKRRVIEKEVMIEPRIREEVIEVKPDDAIKESKPKPVKPSKPRKPRKPKEETYAQLVALESNGVMDDDMLGTEQLDLSKKPTKVTLDESFTEETQPVVSVDERQMDIFETTTKKMTQPKSRKRKI